MEFLIVLGEFVADRVFVLLLNLKWSTIRKKLRFFKGKCFCELMCSHISQKDDVIYCLGVSLKRPRVTDKTAKISITQIRRTEAKSFFFFVETKSIFNLLARLAAMFSNDAFNVDRNSVEILASR